MKHKYLKGVALMAALTMLLYSCSRDKMITQPQSEKLSTAMMANSVSAVATPTTVNIFSGVKFYDGYSSTTLSTNSGGVIYTGSNNNTEVLKKISLKQFVDSATSIVANLIVYKQQDVYDRNGSLTFKSDTTANAESFTIFFISPFYSWIGSTYSSIPYTINLNNYASFFTKYDSVWADLSLWGTGGNPTFSADLGISVTPNANSVTNATYAKQIIDTSVKAPVSSQPLIKSTNVAQNLTNAQLVIQVKGSGAGSGQEEYTYHTYAVYWDNSLVGSFSSQMISSDATAAPFTNGTNRNWVPSHLLPFHSLSLPGSVNSGTHTIKIVITSSLAPFNAGGGYTMGGVDSTSGSSNLFFVSLIAGGGNPVTTTSSGIVSGATYQLVSNVNNSSVLDVTGGGTSDGTKVELWSNNSPVSANQKWTITSVGNGYYKLQPANAPTKCLDVANSSITDGTQVQIYTDNNTNAQKWQIIDAGSGYYSLAPANAPNSRLDVNAAATANGTKVQIWTSNSSSAQKWKLVKQ